jgi:hypothetical protein
MSEMAGAIFILHAGRHRRHWAGSLFARRALVTLSDEGGAGDAGETEEKQFPPF